MDVEPGKSLVNGSPLRQGQTPRTGGAAPHRMQPPRFALVGPAPAWHMPAWPRGRLSIGPAQDRAAMASISTPAPRGRAATPKAARAGRVSPVK